MTNIVPGARYCLEFQNGQFQFLFCLILSDAVCSTLLINLILKITWKTLSHIVRISMLNLL